ncbi:MAG TPA: glycosyltransferase [Caulobacteraceae bacterium]
MPIYNGGVWLRDAVLSVLRQTLTSFELIAVDDGSSDSTPDVLRQLAVTDSRLRVVRQPHLGLVAALNRGLAEATAPLIARLDADDIAHDRRLERQVAFLADQPRVGVVGSWVTEIDMEGRPRGRREPPCTPQEIRQALRRTNPLVHSAIMARTALLRALGGYRNAFEAAEDYDMWLRVSDVADLANMPEALVDYRVHAGSVSQRKALRQCFSVRLAQRSAEARLAGRPDPAERLTMPPDWSHAVGENAFWVDDAALYRWLDGGQLSIDPPRNFVGLTHAERRLAAHATWARMRSPDRLEAADARTFVLELLREQPGLVLKAAWSLRA